MEMITGDRRSLVELVGMVGRGVSAIEKWRDPYRCWATRPYFRTSPHAVYYGRVAQATTPCSAATCAPTDPDVRNYRIRFLKEWIRYT